jgi:hypothetical protein
VDAQTAEPFKAVAMTGFCAIRQAGGINTMQ